MAWVILIFQLFVCLPQTAKGIAFNEDISKSSHVRILFDNRSQRSYITSNKQFEVKVEFEAYEKKLRHYT